jgi:hypothetical protein
MHPGRKQLAKHGDLLGRPAPSRAWDGDRGGILRMALAAAGGGVERRQQCLQAQTQKHLTMMTKDTMKAAPAMLKAQLDMEAPEMEALWALPKLREVLQISKVWLMKP